MHIRKNEVAVLRMALVSALAYEESFLDSIKHCTGSMDDTIKSTKENIAKIKALRERLFGKYVPSALEQAIAGAELINISSEAGRKRLAEVARKLDPFDADTLTSKTETDIPFDPDAEAHAAELNRLQKENDQLKSDASWRENPDRSGGAYTEEEKNRDGMSYS